MQFDLFKPKAPPLFGLDISSSSVKMLEIVEAGKGAYRVERYAIEALPRDAIVDGNINNLEAVTESVQTTAYTAMVEVAPNRVLLAYDRLPRGWNPIPKGEKGQIFLLEFEYDNR